MKEPKLLPIADFSRYYGISRTFLKALKEYKLVDISVVKGIEYIQLDQLKYQSTLQQQRAEVEYLNASYVLTNNLQQAGITKKNLQLAVGVFNSRKALYNEGVSSLVELLDAERELTNARKLSLQADVNVKTGWLDLHKANGTLLTDFIKSI